MPSACTTTTSPRPRMQRWSPFCARHKLDGGGRRPNKRRHFDSDEKAAQDTIFRGLAASGWHTAAMTMRLLVESELKPAGGIVGAGADEFRWPRPVRPGDEFAPQERSTGCAAVDVTPEPGPDQSSHDHAEPGQRPRADPGRQSGGAAPPELGAGPRQRSQSLSALPDDPE